MSSDTLGIDQGGIALMLDSPRLQANGYLITRRTLQNQSRLWKIIQGENPTEPIIESPLLAKPYPGDEFKIQLSSDQTGNHFRVFINGWEDITITDTSFFMNPAIISEFYCGVMLAGGKNNNVDNFKVVTRTGTAHVMDIDNSPTDYILFQNFPNPFNSSTSIQFYLPKEEKVKIEIINNRGQVVMTIVNRVMNAGRHQIIYNPQHFSSGLYIYKMKTERFIDVKKMIYIK